MDDDQFIFACCQRGAEPALKREVTSNWPDLRFAYSQPGFVTFKNCGKTLSARFELKTVFARTYGFSIGSVKSENLESATEQFRTLIADSTFDHLHVWKRDLTNPDHNQYRPGSAEDSSKLAKHLLKAVPNAIAAKKPNRVAGIDQSILDVIELGENDWWIGSHTATSHLSRHPGGSFPIEAPDPMVSRAYLKMAEALAWARLPIHKGDRWVEIGSAPGGACQALLQQDQVVLGIDPSTMHDSILNHPNFTHVKKRGADLKRAEYAGYRWLAIDTNVAPKHTLDTIEDIVTHSKVKFDGMIITLKLLDWKLAEQLAEMIGRVRSWGFSDVRCRQLSYNRQEVCIAAIKNRASRRLKKKPAKRNSKPRK